MRCPVAIAVVCAALAGGPTPAAAKTNSKQCNGEFVCSDFVSERPGLSYFPQGGGSEKCTYGHIEQDGDCHEPCEGTRYAVCRCKDKEEAEEEEAARGQTSLIVSAIISAVGLCCCSRAELRGTGSLENKFKDYLLEEPSQAAEPAQVHVVEARVVGTSNDNEAEPSREPSGGLRRNPSRIEVLGQQNPRKLAGVSGFLALLPIIMLSYWVVRMSLDSEKGPLDTWSYFMVTASIIMYILNFATVILFLLARIGFPGLVKCFRDNPVYVLQVIQARTMLCLIFVGVAGCAWSFNRMSNPEGVYSKC